MTPGTSEARGAILSLLLALHLGTEKAKEVAKLLLKLGATSRQADMRHVTLLHSVVAANKAEILDLLLETDLSAKTILNNLGGGYRFDSPLKTAIGYKFEDIVQRLLNAGAKPRIEFEDWIKGYLRYNTFAMRRSSEANMNTFRQQHAQPIIVAAANETTTVVEALIHAGADPNTLTPVASSKLSNPTSKNTYLPETVLDIVQTNLNHLNKYDGFAKTLPKKPEELLSESHYLKGIKKGTYAYWSASRDYQAKKAEIDDESKRYREAVEKKPDQGTDEKMEAVRELIGQYERLEKFLKEKGGKKFYECGSLVMIKLEDGGS